MGRREAEAVLDGYLAEEAEKRPMSALNPAGQARIAQAAAERLNRAARRALGHRGDGRYHPLAAAKAVPRGRQ